MIPRRRYGFTPGRALPRLRLEILPRAGHLPWIDQPEQFQALVRQGLEHVTGTGSP